MSNDDKNARKCFIITTRYVTDSIADCIRDRAQWLINWKRSMEDSQITLQQLQYRRNVSATCVFYRVHKMGVGHLHSLRGTKAIPLAHNLRRSSRREEEISVSRLRTEQHLRSFVRKYTRMWNFLVQETSLKSLQTLQAFKSQTHRWLN